MSRPVARHTWLGEGGSAWPAVLMLSLSTPAGQQPVWHTLTLNAESRKFIGQAVAREPVIREGPEAGRPARRRAVVRQVSCTPAAPPAPHSGLLPSLFTPARVSRSVAEGG